MTSHYLITISPGVVDDLPSVGQSTSPSRLYMDVTPPDRMPFFYKNRFCQTHNLETVNEYDRYLSGRP